MAMHGSSSSAECMLSSSSSTVGAGAGRRWRACKLSFLAPGSKPAHKQPLQRCYRSLAHMDAGTVALLLKPRCRSWPGARKGS